MAEIKEPDYAYCLAHSRKPNFGELLSVQGEPLEPDNFRIYEDEDWVVAWERAGDSWGLSLVQEVQPRHDPASEA